MKFLKQSTATVIAFGPGLLPSDGVTLVTSLVSALDNATTGIMLCKNGAAAAVRHATVTATSYDAYGSYLVTLDATDTGTVGRLRVMFAAAASCLPIWEDFTVLSANVFDSLIGATANLKIDLDTIKTQAVTAAAGVTVLASVGTAATSTAQTGDAYARLGAAGAGLTALGDTRIANLDATISSRTKPADTQAAVTLVSTLTTYTGNTPQTGDSYARLGAPAGASHSADVAAVKVDTAAIKLKTDNLPAAPAAVGDIVSAAAVASAVGSRTPTESYAADGVAPTYDQFFYMLWACMAQFAITSTTISAKKLDGSTEAMQFTLNDATTPTSRTRTT